MINKKDVLQVVGILVGLAVVAGVFIFLYTYSALAAWLWFGVVGAVAVDYTYFGILEVLYRKIFR